jgi:pyruvate dehydrogenase E1 component alpha subunit
VERASAVVDLHLKAEAYSVAHDWVDGMDVLQVHRAVRKAAAEARKGKPWFLEMKTYRFRGHSMSDPAHSHYRTKEEVESERERDPISRLQAYLQEQGLASQEDFKAMDKDVSAEIKAAMDAALQSPEPDPATVWDHVYASDPYRPPSPR